MSNRKPLAKKELERLKQILVTQRDSLIFNDIYVSDEFNMDAEDRSDEVDLANADVSNAHRLRFRNRETFYKKKLQEAIKRIESGTYGRCEECDSQIGFKRLEARPTAELCIICKEESEKDEHNSILGRQSKSLGKEMNLASA